MNRREIDFDNALGAILRLCMQSGLHRHWSVVDIERNFFPPVWHRFCKIWYDDSNTPCACATWAEVAIEVENEFFRRSKTPPLDQWNSGNRLWFVDFIAPNVSGFNLVRDLHRNHFRNRTGYAIRRNLDGSIRKWCKFRGLAHGAKNAGNVERRA
ncbi:toxin-activating lysine-acyltransferase [Roseobacter sinensis]|uniref:RTX toxin-activating lysine-acyltransferase n=1 Tax=Roseobacter sinensis TaxID=2931391 RepID=A0ABT3BLF1_9RHOB|nr:toxin-activating lysine-acyltransferase [Roseobacter sp. WL0113]MCV3274385.1 toxin-activating lysine-acyltransferase [Roseobacter sp. WL0113]